MNTYLELKKRHQAEFNAFPMEFAFGRQQIEAGLKKLGLEPTDTDKVYSFGDTGGFYRRSDEPALQELLDRHDRERKEAIAADKTGDGFIFEMFSCELGNHEYSYTSDISNTLDALGLTDKEISVDRRLLHGLKKACKREHVR